MRRAISTLAILSLAILAVAAAASTIVVSGQLLAYQDGYVFFTTGDGFRVAHGVVIRDAKTGGTTALAPAPRLWARATFDSSGTVTELDLSRDQLPAQGNFADVTHFAVALSSPAPNPDLLAAVETPQPGRPEAPDRRRFSGRPVLVTFIVQVPPYTPFTSSIYIATDQSGWNAQAIPMDRVDALHYQITRRFNSGTAMRYLYNRGSLQTQEVGQNGLARTPRDLLVTDADVRVIRDVVYAWQDATPGGLNQVQPQIMPTPYNPAPFPNLPQGLPPPQPPHGKPPPPP